MRRARTVPVEMFDDATAEPAAMNLQASAMMRRRFVGESSLLAPRASPPGPVFQRTARYTSSALVALGHNRPFA